MCNVFLSGFALGFVVGVLLILLLIAWKSWRPW